MVPNVNDFESFLTDQQSQATQPAAPAAPPDFESFMRQAKGEQDGAVLQSAQATAVVNSQQDTGTAAAAAPLARQLGLPQPAVEADLPRFQQQARAQQNATLLSQNPVLARWVAANPDSARIAQDELQRLASIEQIFGAGSDSLGSIGYAGLQSVAGSYNSGALAINRHIATLAQALGPEAADWAQRNLVAPRAGAQAALALPADAGIGQRAAATVGSLLGLLSQVTLTGGIGEAAPTSATVGEALAQAGETAVRSMAFPSLTAATNKGSEVYEKTGDQSAATKAALAEYLFTTAQGLVPFSAPGGLATRAISGAVSGATMSETQRSVMNLLLPEELHQEFDPQETLFQALSAAVLGGALGPHNAPNYIPAIRRTYVQSVLASQAVDGVGKVAALEKEASALRLRQADVGAFHSFMQNVSENSSLDAVYVNARDLSDALAQFNRAPTDRGGDGYTQRQANEQARSQVQSVADLTTVMPDLQQQIGEGVLTGGDVRISVADYATHIAGTPLAAKILPNLKVSPDGMTFAEGQAYFQDQVKTLQAKADEIVQDQVAHVQAMADKQQVFDRMLLQLQATGRYPDSVAKMNATLVSEFYATQAERMGMTASQLHEQMPLGVQSWMEARPSERLGPSAEPTPEPTAARSQATADVVALRKRESVLSSLLECLAAG